MEERQPLLGSPEGGPGPSTRRQHLRPIRNANDPSVLENGTVLNRFAGYLAFGVVALVVENAILADTIGRVEVVALIAVGLNVFFFLYHNIACFDTAWHTDWIVNATIFGNSCDASQFIDWVHDVVHETPPPGPGGQLSYSHETHTAFVDFTLFGHMAAAPLAIFLSFTSARRHCGRTMVVSSWLIPASGIALLAVWLDGIDKVFICNPCIVTLMANFFMGLGLGLQWCFGLPYLMGYTRPKPHHHVQHLMGGLAIPILCGDFVGFSHSYYLEGRTWLLLAAIIPITAVLPPLLCFDELLAYGHPNKNRVADNTSVYVVDLRLFALEFPLFMRDGGFWWSVFLSSTLWSTVDVSGQVYRIAFGSFLSHIGEDEHHAGSYAIWGDVASAVTCFCFVLIGIFIVSRYSEETQENFAYRKLVLCAISAFFDLLAMVICDAIPDDDLPTTHWIIGSGYVVYRVCSALEYETLLELTPKLMRKKEEILHCWCLTLFVRVVFQWFVLRLIHKMLHIWNWPLWGIFAFQLMFKLIFVVFASARLKPQPPVEAVPIARPAAPDVAAEQDAVLAARVFDGAAVQIPERLHNQANAAGRYRGPGQVVGSEQYYAGRQGPLGSAPLVGIAGFPRP